MKYLLDTCVISDLVKGEPGTLKQMKSISPRLVTTSTITLMETYYGLFLNEKRAEKIQPLLQSFLKAITVMSFNEQDAKQAADIRAQLKKKGRPIGAYDILIAGMAVNRDLVLVTANEKEFKSVPHLIVENWRNAHHSA